jgi:hypothetical protein
VSLRLAFHWLATTIAAACLATVATILPPPYGGWVGAIAAAAVCLIGLAIAPSIRKAQP